MNWVAISAAVIERTRAGASEALAGPAPGGWSTRPARASKRLF
jgi:hypothetical protein